MPATDDNGQSVILERIADVRSDIQELKIAVSGLVKSQVDFALNYATEHTKVVEAAGHANRRLDVLEPKVETIGKESIGLLRQMRIMTGILVVIAVPVVGYLVTKAMQVLFG